MKRESMIVYHGTNALFEAVDFAMSRDKRDFGQGFYSTTLYDQARTWAQNMFLRYGGGQYVYEMLFTPFEGLSIMQYDDLSVEWLEMVKENRLSGGVQHSFDVMIGPVANDNTMRTVALYVSGIYSATMALEQLRYFKANDQVSFHTEKSLGALRILRRIDITKPSPKGATP
ncbi:MAG: DUF3990 domain-containing protein [Oscillospiraceae bacterium]|jgi:hypothetical protein|nr:DUF3990 domain-containing protein [Oscillospiraceae bacterium]